MNDKMSPLKSTPHNELAGHGIPVTHAPIKGTPITGLPAKRMALYARVSTEEQTKGNYPSCESQIEELEDECRRRGWQINHYVRDAGYSAGSLKRPGLTELRGLVAGDEIDGILCTWYDRLTRSREFYVLDAEFRNHGVEFITLHDATNTATAAGRFMESMLVAAKTYDREQTSEKVSTKMRQRQEKGLHQGGIVPFAFLCEEETKRLVPDQDKLALLHQLFQVYVDTQSDFAVRDWLHAHGVPAARGKALWQVSSLRSLLCNRRYIGEIEINRKNKGVQGVGDAHAFHVVKAEHGPMVPVDLFELAQSIRRQKRAESVNRKGRPRSYSQTQCQRVYSLQGVLRCGCCRHAMTPWYVHHKPGKHRKTESYINYYACAQQIKHWKYCDHKNMVLARIAEAWILERIDDLVQAPSVVEKAMEIARARCESDLLPQKEALSLNKTALAENEEKIARMLETVESGVASGALLAMLNEKATHLQVERERLRAESRRLNEALLPLDHYFDAGAFRQRLADFSQVRAGATPEELQRLLRLAVRKIEWMPGGDHCVEYYFAPRNRSGGQDQNWFKTSVQSDTPGRTRTSNQGIMSPLL